MDDKQITDSIRALDFAEPPLGFDPDDVAEKAAKRARNRRATTIAGVGTFAVIGAIASAGMFLAPGSSHDSIQVAASTARPTSAGSPGSAATTIPPTPAQDPAEQMKRNRQHLRDVLGTMLTGAKDINVSEFVQQNETDIFKTSVSYRDEAGPATFDLIIKGPVASHSITMRDDRCEPALDASGRLIIPESSPAVAAGRQPNKLRCGSRKWTDGTAVITTDQRVTQLDPPSDSEYVEVGAVHYRTDSTTVSVWDTTIANELASHPDGQNLRQRPALNGQQILALITDPAFKLN